jgi:hypothetical protein
LAKLRARPAATCALRGETTIASPYPDELSPVTIAAAMVPQPMNPSLMSRLAQGFSRNSKDGRRYLERSIPTALAQGIPAWRPCPYTLAQLQRRCIVHIVLAQMIVTAVLLFGFSAEVLFSHFSAK